MPGGVAAAPDATLDVPATLTRAPPPPPPAQVPMPYAQNLEAAALPQVDHVVATVKRMMAK